MDWTLSSDPLTIARLSMTSYVFIVLHILLLFSTFASSLTCPSPRISFPYSHSLSTSSPSSLTTSSFQAVDMTSASPSGRRYVGCLRNMKWTWMLKALHMGFECKVTFLWLRKHFVSWHIGQCYVILINNALFHSSCTCYLGSTITQRYEDGLCQTNSTNKDRWLEFIVHTNWSLKTDVRTLAKWHCLTYLSYSSIQTSPNVLEVDRIIIPVNLNNTHWACAVIYIKEKRIVYYDSMSVSIKAHEPLYKGLCGCRTCRNNIIEQLFITACTNPNKGMQSRVVKQHRSLAVWRIQRQAQHPP